MPEIDRVKQWRTLAEADSRSAKHLRSLYPMPLEIICYHCQQAVEKYLKGMLCQWDLDIPRSHDLMKLNRMCQEIELEFDQILESCSNLSPYGTTVRYPSHEELLDVDMEQALRDLELCEQFIRSQWGKSYT